jgi:hypothetical protein
MEEVQQDQTEQQDGNHSNIDPYWASVPGTEIADNILDKVENYYKYLSISGRLDLWKRSWTYYYRPLMTGARLTPTGSQGELTSFSANNYRNLLVHLETMTTQQRAAFEPRATNSDVKSQSQVILADGLLEYYMREKKLERNIKEGVKVGLMMGEAFVRAEWEPQGGQIYGKSDSGATIYEGDMKYTNYTPLNVIRDFTLENPANHDWYILRDFQNKYTLSAKYPDIAEDIMNDSLDLLEEVRTTTLSAIGLEESDNVPVYTLIHKPTPAMPGGRYTTVLGNGTKMLDGPLPYKETHVYRIAPDEQTGSIFGYTVGFDLIPVQEALDILYSTVITNQSTFGVQNILMPAGSNLSTSQLAGGLNLISYDPKIGKPEPLQLTQTPAEIFNFIQMLERLQETLSGVNSVARGNPEASLKSGAALALVQSMAIQFSMGLQQAYAQLIEDLGTGTIHILQDFAAVPRVAAIAGKSNRPLMKEFVGKDLDKISRVMVDMGNPMTQTTAGKVNLAESLLQQNMIENPDQYIQVVTTGRLEPIIEGKQAELLLIKAENEGLADGTQQRAIITDKHDQHILEHKTVLASPEVRQDPNSPIMAQTLAHIQEHINFLKTADPVLLQLIHEQSFMPPPTPPGAASPAPMMDATNPITQQAQKVNQPNMPTNPMTGQQAPTPPSAA